jgi:hypothetical protein
MSRSRVSQYLRLLDLPGDVIEYMTAPENQENAAYITEGALRGILRFSLDLDMSMAFAKLLSDWTKFVQTPHP